MMTRRRDIGYRGGVGRGWGIGAKHERGRFAKKTFGGEGFTEGRLRVGSNPVAHTDGKRQDQGKGRSKEAVVRISSTSSSDESSAQRKPAFGREKEGDGGGKRI